MSLQYDVESMMTKIGDYRCGDDVLKSVRLGWLDEDDPPRQRNRSFLCLVNGIGINFYRICTFDRLKITT
jgi:hypothetical protein